MIKGFGFISIRAIERTCLLLGSVFVVFFLSQIVVGENQRQHDIFLFEQKNYSPAQTQNSRQVIIPGERLETNTSAPDKSLWSPSRVKAYLKSLQQHSSPVLAVLRIPSLNLHVPVYDGAGSLHLNRGVARITGTALPNQLGNMGIAGHRDGYFRALKDIKVGAKIELETDNGKLYFRVFQTQIVDPTAIEVLDHSASPSITLVTCYPFYYLGQAPKRYIVTAMLDS